MSEGIGAPVKRKEDKRFITGKGQIHRRHPGREPGLCGLCAVSACPCEGDRHQCVAARGHGGRDCRFERCRADRRRDRQYHLRLGDHLEGWQPDEHGRLERFGDGYGALHGRCGCGCDRRDESPGARAAAEAVEVTYQELPVAANIEAALAGGAPQLHENAPGNVI